jgi:hypothetical protein
MTDPDLRALRLGAARTASLIAIPIALGIGALSLWRFGAFDGASPRVSSTPPVQATGPVTMAAPTLSDDVAAVCRAVVAHLPETVHDANRRPVSAGDEQNAAYGEPALTVACGAPIASVDPTALVYPLGGVCFVAAAGSGGAVWTTVDRQVPVVVTVPGDTDGSAQSVVPLTPAIAFGDPPAAAKPSGCP